MSYDFYLGNEPISEGAYSVVESGVVNTNDPFSSVVFKNEYPDVQEFKTVITPLGVRNTSAREERPVIQEGANIIAISPPGELLHLAGSFASLIRNGHDLEVLKELNAENDVAKNLLHMEKGFTYNEQMQVVFRGAIYKSYPVSNGIDLCRLYVSETPPNILDTGIPNNWFRISDKKVFFYVNGSWQQRYQDNYFGSGYFNTWVGLTCYPENAHYMLYLPISDLLDPSNGYQPFVKTINDTTDKVGYIVFGHDVVPHSVFTVAGKPTMYLNVPSQQSTTGVGDIYVSTSGVVYPQEFNIPFFSVGLAEESKIISAATREEGNNNKPNVQLSNYPYTEFLDVSTAREPKSEYYFYQLFKSIKTFVENNWIRKDDYWANTTTEVFFRRLSYYLLIRVGANVHVQSEGLRQYYLQELNAMSSESDPNFAEFKENYEFYGSRSYVTHGLWDKYLELVYYGLPAYDYSDPYDIYTLNFIQTILDHKVSYTENDESLYPNILVAEESDNIDNIAGVGYDTDYLYMVLGR
jgi:hypothetical protein